MTNIEQPVISRRKFCVRLLLAITTGPAVSGPLLAQAADRVDEGEAAAVSLGYRHDASQVDTSAFPKRAGAQGAQQFCDNCALFEGESGESWAPCGFFQGRLVAAKGWCNAWVSKS